MEWNHKSLRSTYRFLESGISGTKQVLHGMFWDPFGLEPPSSLRDVVVLALPNPGILCC